MADYDENYVAGCYGTVAEQVDETYYDDRSDADDDLEKGRIKFPKNKLYGRERELALLRQLFGEINSKDSKLPVAGSPTRVSFGSNNESRVVFLSGYSGIGKSALVKEFINQVQNENSSVNESMMHFSGKYLQQSGGAAPFSAISEVFEKMVSSLTSHQRGHTSEGGKINEGADNTRLLCTRIWQKIQSSDVIGPEAGGNEALIDIFPSLRPLLDGRCVSGSKMQRQESMSNVEGREEKGEPSMNSIKQATSELLNVITSSLQRPLLLFLDDLQWADGPSMELLLFLLENAQIMNSMFICAYRSNEVDADHPFSNVMTKVTESRGQSVMKLDLFSLSQEAVNQFIADSIGMDEVDRAQELVEVVYPKTMGNIFCVMQAIEELVRKNALYYDVMCFEWRWTVDKVELANQVSADVVETIKEKIKSLSVGIQNLLVVMAYIPCSVGVPVLKELLMTDENSALSESEIVALLKEACEEGMLIWSTESGHYILAHDRIREASRGYLGEEDRDELLLHMADVLLSLGKGSKMEWCLYTAVDLLNSLPLDKVNVTDAIKLNLRVSRMAKRRGSPEKENALLRESMDRLQPFKWKDYQLSLKVYNAVIVSEFTLGNHDRTTAAIDEVLNHGKCLLHKCQALLYRVKSTCQANGYAMAVTEGVKILKMFSYNIPLKPRKLDMVREKIRLKLAFSGRSYASLTNLPVAEDPLSEIFYDTCKDCLFSGQPRLLLMVAWTAIRRAIERGSIDRFFPPLLVSLGVQLGKKGKVNAANEIGNVALTLSEKFRKNKADYSFIQFFSYSGIIFYLQSFRSGLDVLQECHKELKFSGRFELCLASMLNYFNAYFAAGLSLGSILESKLLVLDEFSRSIDRMGFASSFQIHRQFVMNLRQRSEHPTLFDGPAFQQETALNGITDEARKMTLRDASIYRLALAFIYNDVDCMAAMLETLSGYPLEDPVVARLFLRACFMGLAAFSLAEKNSVIGNKCLKYFRRMKKLGSTNAPPAYFFITALKKPTKNAFIKAIESCAEASMPHLEAMARERYAVFLRTHNELELANSQITSAYWLYYDWGAHGKSFSLGQEYPFLKEAKRAKPGSHGTSSRSGTKATSVNESVMDTRGVIKRKGTFDYNSTFGRRQLVKK